MTQHYAVPVGTVDGVTDSPMLRSNRVHTSIAVFLVVMVFVTMANFLAAARVSHAFSGPAVAGTVCDSAHPGSSVPEKDDFKPPKQSFVDYDIFFTCAAFKPTNRHSASCSAPDIGSKALSGALAEILIPPKI